MGKRNMNKQLLIGGSILAVVVLVLAGLSPVVGYNSAESGVKDSPLFHLRTQRALNKDENVQVCAYLGKGKLLPFPVRNDKSLYYQRFLDKISRMDDKVFDRFLDVIMNYLRQDHTINDEEIDEIITMFHLLNSNPQEKKKYIITKESGFLSEDPDTVTDPITVCLWFPGCVPWLLFFVLLEMVAILTFIIAEILIFLGLLTDDPIACM
jgi:hypothetical protein